MSYTLQLTIPANPATGNINGQVVNVYIGSRFSPANVAPATNASPPGGGADYGPLTGSDVDTGFVVTVNTPDQFIVSYEDPTDTSNGGSFNTYWIGPFLINPSTNLVGWTAVSTAGLVIADTTIAAGSNGATLPQTSISVASTTGFLSSGTLIIYESGLPATVVTYTGVSGGNTFTGCAGGTGTLTTAQRVVFAHQNGNYRRLVFMSLLFKVLASSDSAQAVPVTTIGGSLVEGATVGLNVDNLTASVEIDEDLVAIFAVDPAGYYGVRRIVSGTGVAQNSGCTQLDF